MYLPSSQPISPLCFRCSNSPFSFAINIPVLVHLPAAEPVATASHSETSPYPALRNHNVWRVEENPPLMRNIARNNTTDNASDRGVCTMRTGYSVQSASRFCTILIIEKHSLQAPSHGESAPHMRFSGSPAFAADAWVE
jgi:hypothetical protein